MTQIVLFNGTVPGDGTGAKGQTPWNAFNSNNTELYSKAAFFGVDSGVANAYVVLLTSLQPQPAVAPTLAAGQFLRFTPANPSSGASTLNFAGTGAVAIVSPLGAALTGTELQSQPTLFMYNGAAWQIVSPNTVALINKLLTQAGIAAVLYPQTGAESAASVTPTNFFYEPWRGEDVRRIGATGGGVVDDRAALFAANSIGSALYFPPGTYKISSAITFTVPLLMDLGAILKPDAGVTVTINAPVSAGPWQIFNVSNAGATITTTGALTPMTYGARFLTEWFGTVGDNVTDDTVAIQNTVNLAFDANFKGIQLLSKLYHTTGAIVCNQHGASGQSFYTPSWFGTDPRKCQILLRGAAAGTPALIFTGGSGQQAHATVENIGFNGDANSEGISFEGQNGVRAINCVFDTNLVGVRFYNNAVNSFTEYCQAIRCEFTPNCASAVQYAKNLGNTSMHGSGLRECTINSPAGSGVNMILVGAGVLPYNAPLDAQVWMSAATTTNCVLIANSSTLPVNFHGDLTIEILGVSNNLTLASSNTVFSACRINVARGDQVLGGTFAQCEAVQTNADSSIVALGVRYARTLAAVVGVNTLNSAVGGQTRIVDVRITGTGYDWRGTFIVTASGSGVAGYQAALMTNLVNNTAAYGAPTPLVSTIGMLTLTNNTAGFNTTTIIWSEKSIGPGTVSGSAQAQF